MHRRHGGWEHQRFDFRHRGAHDTGGAETSASQKTCQTIDKEESGQQCRAPSVIRAADPWQPLWAAIADSTAQTLLTSYCQHREVVIAKEKEAHCIHQPSVMPAYATITLLQCWDIGKHCIGMALRARCMHTVPPRGTFLHHRTRGGGRAIWEVMVLPHATWY